MRSGTPVNSRSHSHRNASGEEKEVINEFLSENSTIWALQTFRDLISEERLFLAYFAKYISTANETKNFIKNNTVYKGVVYKNVPYNIFVNGSFICISFCVLVNDFTECQPNVKNVKQRPASPYRMRVGSSTPSEKSVPTMNQSSSTQEPGPRDVVQNDSTECQPNMKNVQQQQPSAHRMRQKTCVHGDQCRGYKNGKCPFFHGKVDHPVAIIAENQAETSIQNPPTR